MPEKMMAIQDELSEIAKNVEDSLRACIPAGLPVPSILSDAMGYSLFAGGKRLRPILVLAANRLLDGVEEEALPLACGVEMIHTYSLIHDDLPAMDNDDWRRGKLTNHKVFGEGIAILAGDGLLNQAFEVMLENASRYPHKLSNHLEAIRIIAKGAGIHGMIGGQVLDLEGEKSQMDEVSLAEIHQRKTGALITASLLAGLCLQNPTRKQWEAVEAYGKKIGMVFQIIDDILDITGEQEKLGKSMGGDVSRCKLTYPRIFGLEASRQMADKLTREAMDLMDAFGSKGRFLKDLADYLRKRDH
jgi:geranylgeranyl diphosphate synthase type II